MPLTDHLFSASFCQVPATDKKKNLSSFCVCVCDNFSFHFFFPSPFSSSSLILLSVYNFCILYLTLQCMSSSSRTSENQKVALCPAWWRNCSQSPVVNTHSNFVPLPSSLQCWRLLIPLLFCFEGRDSECAWESLRASGTVSRPSPVITKNV